LFVSTYRRDSNLVYTQNLAPSELCLFAFSAPASTLVRAFEHPKFHPLSPFSTATPFPSLYPVTWMYIR